MESLQGLFEGQTLDALGIKYGTDKSSKQHDYLRKYQFFLDKWKNDTFTCLELGVKNGSSLKMWRDFFPNARVIGADVATSVLSKVDGMECKIGDCGDIEFLTSLQSYMPRLIIDDASHKWNHMLNAFFTLFPHIVGGGIYILEDICASFEPWAAKYKSHESVTPFHVMETLAECLTSQEKTQSGKQVLPLMPPSPYQSLIEAIAKTVDSVVFIKFSCLIIKKKRTMFVENDLKALATGVITADDGQAKVGYMEKLTALKKFCLGKKEIIIYGMGHYGKRIAQILKKENIYVSAFVLSDGINKPTSPYTRTDGSCIPVYSISELPFNPADIGLIVALSTKHVNEVLPYIKSFEFIHIFQG